MKTYISLFSSAGVGCYGFKENGYECIATCELLEPRMEIQRANNKCKYQSGYIVGDLTSTVIKEKLFSEYEMWKKRESLNDVDVVVATPPCQGMSTANYKKGDESARNSLVVEAISIIKELKPKVFVFENVKAFLKTTCTDKTGEFMPINDCIRKNLSDNYHIYARVINFKDYGVPSSRPRTLVIGTRKDCIHFSPLNIFPLKQNEITVREAIGNLPALSFGEISNDDPLHFFREYPKYMEEWISHISEGESAFQNAPEYQPYKIVDGKRVLLKGAHLGNKFRRLFWDKPGSCIATRNDQLASQDTIHPRDNRVLSIRELMRLMTIPDNFKWSTRDLQSLTSCDEVRSFLKDNELNIRRCIGEAVPTRIMSTIAKNAKEMIEFQEYVDRYYANRRLVEPDDSNSFYQKAFYYEMGLSDAKDSGSYYTPQSVVYETIANVDLSDKNSVDILEPSVGMGAFLPQLFRLCDECASVNIDVCDICANAISELKELLSCLRYNKDKIRLHFICEDFITTNALKNKYDLIISNPPFANANKKKITEYRQKFNCGKTRNVFVYFLARYLELSDEIVVVLPKSFIMAADYSEIRRQYEKFGISRIIDFGVRYFKDVFVEILSIHFKKSYSQDIYIENKLSKETLFQKQGYIFHDHGWLLYRNDWFDRYICGLNLGVFDFYRDRQLTNSKVKASGDVWVLRSKNILDNGEIIHIDGYDRFIDKSQLNSFSVSRYINSGLTIMPNFTYLTRATVLPPNCIPNGSIAILIPKKKDISIDTSLYATEEFRKYYEIVKNRAKFTLNIDSESIYYIGVKQNDD